ncbi:glycosyltransferase [Pararhodobacter sp. CCB-MM2]|uniref:glycosyltransferase n=1 Tax=Pararhodobacter sp. CCB-MM2 TaxID=1786003 RepID=UPI00131427E1|nr:glycosyltransferase [Pararhodobacter sp. CCB-MM2]
MQTYYLDHHLDLALPGCALRDKSGANLGYLEELRLYQGRIHLRGWARVPRLGIRLGETQIWRSPHDEREDVAKALNFDRHVGFRASLPYDHGLLLLELDTPEGRVEILHDMRVEKTRRRASRGLRLRFWRDTLPIVPMILRGLWRKDPDLPRRIKAALRLGLPASELSLDADFLAAESSSAAPRLTPNVITIIMPIYNAFELLEEALSRVVAHTDLPFHLVLIDDASPDDRVRPWLRAWVESLPPTTRVDLLENETNLGFIQSVNRGFAHAHELALRGPVILLNSDAMVPAGWASRLTAPLEDPMVATATPLSSDAEIFNIPIVCVRSELEDGQVDKIDALLQQQISASAPEVRAPTGVGFCMAMHWHWLADLGGLDTVFGRGYGEEVDWCRRAVAKGAHHVAVPNLFVEHRGGASFGPEKLALIQKNNAVIATRYPGYDRLVQTFIREDPLITARMVGALAWAETNSNLPQIPVYIAHSMGGGAESYLQDRLQKEAVSVVIRLGGAFRCRIELATPQGRLIANTESLELVERLLAPVTKRKIIYSCAVGDSDLGEIPSFLTTLAVGAEMDILLHDYLPLSPSYTLLDQDGVYRGLPDIATQDPAHRYHRPNGVILSLEAWRHAWGMALRAATRVQVFSEASAALLKQAYPEAETRLVVAPHSLLHPLPQLSVDESAVITIGVLGAIGPQKGAAIVVALSEMLSTRADINLALIGRIAPGYVLADSTQAHGTYAVEDIPHLAKRYGITHWLIPSVWPETFSYTVHECLATGLPTLAFDLGAQGDAVRKAKNGTLLRWSADQSDPETLARSILEALGAKED